MAELKYKVGDKVLIFGRSFGVVVGDYLGYGSNGLLSYYVVRVNGMGLIFPSVSLSKVEG